MPGIHEAHGFQMEGPEGEEAEEERKEGGRMKGKQKPELWITSDSLVTWARSPICSASLPFDNVPGLKRCRSCVRPHETVQVIIRV